VKKFLNYVFFDKYNIINSVNSYGSVEITAGQINEFREL